MSLINTKSKDHCVTMVIPSWRQVEDNNFAENYNISWSWDYRDSAGFRATQHRSKRTTMKRARAFAKKHKVDMPNDMD